MTETRPRAPEQQDTQPRAGRLLLIIGLPVLAVLLIGGVVLAVGLPFLFRGTVHQQYSVAAGSTVSVSVSNSRFDFAPSTDGRVHVRVDGWALGRPRFTVRTEGTRTTVHGECGGLGWFGDACSLNLHVTLPAASNLDVSGDNGAIAARDLDGRIAAETTNGAIGVRGVSGDLILHTTNGAVTLADAGSDSVEATTTNGEVEMRFTDPPRIATARSTNGEIVVAVPGTATYAVSADTTNGAVDTSRLRTDPGAAHRIVAQTTNGGVRVEPTAG
jgi:hypothetical protein